MSKPCIPLRIGVAAALAFASSIAARATAQPREPATVPSETKEGPREPPPPPAEGAAPLGRFSALGYLEAFYAYNFNQPTNGVTHFRGFDNRHNTFSLANVALGGTWEKGPVFGRLVLQVGSTPSTYYLAEPASSGGAGANASGSELWKYVQEAYGGLRIPFRGRAFVLSAGLFLSPIGPESMAVKDNWNWSRSNLFFGLPFYHTGARLAYEASDRLTLTMHVYNGWNSVVDGNDGKSLAASASYDIPGRLRAQVLYFGGPERPKGAVEGPGWRHSWDAFAFVEPHPRVSLGAHGNLGLESTRMGDHTWQAAALYARVKVASAVYVAARGDAFREKAATDAAGATSGAIFWPSEWMGSATGTLDVRPYDGISLRLEYRHDRAGAPTFFRGNVTGEGTPSSPHAPNAKQQDTLLFGLVAWFEAK